MTRSSASGWCAGVTAFLLPALLAIVDLRLDLRLIRFRGHLPKGGCDVQNGIKRTRAAQYYDLDESWRGPGWRSIESGLRPDRDRQTV